VGLDSYEAAGGSVTRDLFAKDGEGYADDPELVQHLADEKLDRLTSEAEAEGWGEVIAAEQTPYQSYSWHRLSPDESEGSYSAEAKGRAVLLIVVDHRGETTAIAYSRKAQRSVPRDTGGTLPRPLYDARMTGELSRMRTAALQAEVARNQRLAFAVLLDVLLPMLIGDSVSAHAIQLRSGPAIQEPTPVFDYNTREMACPFEGVANLIASVPEDEAERFAWVLALDDESVARTLAACTGALIDATQGKYADRERLRCVDRIARCQSRHARALGGRGRVLRCDQQEGDAGRFDRGLRGRGGGELRQIGQAGLGRRLRRTHPRSRVVAPCPSLPTRPRWRTCPMRIATRPGTTTTTWTPT
jgi:ParB family chromosome partitioning protein